MRCYVAYEFEPGSKLTTFYDLVFPYGEIMDDAPGWLLFMSAFCTNLDDLWTSTGLFPPCLG
jgi:hypothetical protein